jgi:hypothetical protein
MDLKEIGWEGVDWINLAEDRDEWQPFCEQGNDPLDSIKCLEFIDQLSNCYLLRKDSLPWNQFCSVAVITLALYFGILRGWLA